MVPSLSSSHRTEVYNPKTFFPHAALLGQACAHCPIFPTAASRRSLDRVSVPVWPITLSGRLPIVGLVGLYPTNYLMGREPIHKRISLTPLPCGTVVLCGISSRFQLLSPSYGQVAHALLTRSATQSHLTSLRRVPSMLASFDLHVLSTPPAFVLSQDQTLNKKYLSSFRCLSLSCMSKFAQALFFAFDASLFMLFACQGSALS